MNGIVVGVDGTREADEALRWAVDDTFVRDTTVTAVLAWSKPDCPAAMAGLPAATGAHDAEAAAQQVLQAAVRRVQNRRRPVGVVERVVAGDAASALLAAAEGADLLVVGASSEREHGPSRLGAVTTACMSRATVPVVVVPSSGSHRHRHGVVVVGVDGSTASVGALRWAAETARAGGAVLRVVHVWAQPSGVGGGGAPTLPITSQEAAAAVRDLVADNVESAADGVDHLVVETQFARGAAVDRLTAAAHDAQLLVLGARTVNPARRFDGRSTGQLCLLRATCPVAFVPPQSSRLTEPLVHVSPRAGESA